MATKELSSLHRKRISDSLKKYHASHAKIGVLKSGKKMSDRRLLKQKKAVIIKLAKKREFQGLTKDEQREMDKLGKDIRQLNKKMKATS